MYLIASISILNKLLVQKITLEELLKNLKELNLLKSIFYWLFIIIFLNKGKIIKYMKKTKKNKNYNYDNLNLYQRFEILAINSNIELIEDKKWLSKTTGKTLNTQLNLITKKINLFDEGYDLLSADEIKEKIMEFNELELKINQEKNLFINDYDFQSDDPDWILK
ncbi:hypothetical protein [Mycoplasmopsis cynos]|uniref:hypothetical protein n=1 Tax=Mycoplasmopsis cynos TaxID=171284 RepID=UPI00220F2BB6|nr:hypothetical protein [Mycoplasmopsis cynos]UWV92642.1 hypothetical protein NWE57_00765 [Mycoplasmopsis cynos]